MTDRERTTKGAPAAAGGEDLPEARLRALFAAADPTTEPADALKDRVAALAAQHDARARQPGSHPPRRSWTPGRIGLALTGATALVLIAASLAPTWIAARVLERAEAAAALVENAHILMWSIQPDGSRRKTLEDWVQGDRDRSLDLAGGFVRLQSDGKAWVYEPRLNKVTVQRLTTPPGHGSAGYTLKEFVRDFSHHNSLAQIRMLGDQFVNGRRVHRVAIRSAGWREREVVSVDAATDLLVRGEGQFQVNGRWVSRSISEIQYNESLPARLFQPDFPRTARVFDLDHGQEEWRERLAKGIARQRVGGRTIVIRDIEVNADGDLFLLYTAGRSPGENYWPAREWRLEVSDDRGTFYQEADSNYAHNPTMPAGNFKGYVFNRERLESGWWVPAVPQVPWQPRQFTLTFRMDPIHPRRGDSDPGGRTVYTKSAVFTLPVTAPATDLVPEYMPYMAMGMDANGDAIRRGEARSRAFYYRYEQPDLPRALAYYRKMIDQDEERAKASGQPSFESETWQGIGEVLRQMGHKQEALVALQHAVRDALYPDGQRMFAQQALEALKGDIAWSVGKPAPAFSATDLNGRPQSSARYRGQVLLIDLWATWDDKTRADLPVLKTLYDRYGGKGLGRVR